MLTNVLNPEILYLNKSNIIEAGGDSSEMYVNSIRQALILHANNKIVQPLKPYLRANQEKGHIADRIIAMPGHLSGEEVQISGIKWVGSKNDNPIKRGLERASAVIILNDPDTNYPIAVMEGSLISGMRTAAVSVIGAIHLAKPEFNQISCIGCGIIADFHLKSFIEQFSHIQVINLYDVNQENANALKDKLMKYNSKIKVNVLSDLEDTIRAGEVILTCTVSDKPYIPFEWISPGTFICNVSIMDFEKDVFLKANKVIVDDWDQANREKKVINQLVLEGKFSREMLHAELGEIVAGKVSGRENDEEIIILNPMGMAIEDVYCAYTIYDRALKLEIGRKLSLY
ncbi:2,3-diaminopropionate biosynthesis protein SbnB [Chengkuizengella sp. SCS-71B]|uniref:2,3-diaminopropionate biosynthesis protein SbnB n=1 Tax=Chengkuizengella sp. SCS-71B TaxID=3115290 RepID=UPI0032C2262E